MDKTKEKTAIQILIDKKESAKLELKKELEAITILPYFRTILKNEVEFLEQAISEATELLEVEKQQMYQMWCENLRKLY